MKYALEIASGGKIFMPSFIKIGSGARKLLGEIHIQTHRQEGNLISLLPLFSDEGNWLKVVLGL
jgi:hypothetical protein